MFQDFDQFNELAATADRVAQLRNSLEQDELAGFLVPRVDAHQGEFIAPHDARLPWLSGFTGSAGMAIVLRDKAALFVDGRYLIQAKEQVDTAIFDIVPSHETSPATWLKTTLLAGERLGYDPWLHGHREIESLTKAAQQNGALLLPLGQNPIDAIWSDQPPRPLGAVVVHPATLSGEPSQDKRQRLAAALCEAGHDAAILTLPDSIAWLLNIRGSDLVRSPVALGFAILFADERVVLFMDESKIGADVRAHMGQGVSVAPLVTLSFAMAELRNRRVLLDETTCPVWFSQQLATQGAAVVWGRDPCILPKARKNQTELAGVRQAHLRDGAAMVRFLHWFENAVAENQKLTEIDLVTRLEAERKATGQLCDIAFDTIAGSGPNGAIVHYRVSRSSNRVLQPDELMLIDSGGQYVDGTTDVTRTLVAGTPTDEQRRHFTLVLKGMIAISTARWPRALAGRDLDALARSSLWAAGLDYDHGTGHGVGAYLNVHEGPQGLSRRSTIPLEPGMILSNEPGYYREGAYGIRIENLLAVMPASVPAGGERPMLGFETLTWVPIARDLIAVDLLDPGERAWIDAYHADVARHIGPLLDDDDRAWLIKATAPL